jgi:hypothetical protein
MRRLGAINLGLALVAALLALVAWLEPGLDHPGELPPLTTITPGSVSSIRVFQSGKVSMALELTQDGWRLTAPHAGSADAERVRQLLGILQTPSLRELAVAPERYAAFGLDAPDLVLEVDGLPIAFGGLDPVTSQRYVLVEGTVHLIGDGFRHHLLAGPEGFRPSGR